MADNWKLNKWMDDMTPRRAIQNFFDHATPVDSPDPEELAQPHEDIRDGTPLASQSSQSGGALKRKILSQHTGDEIEGNTSKKLARQDSGEDSSILELSELPSQLASPSIDPLPRPKVVNRKRVSTTTFSQVIQSQESQPTKINESESINDSSIPSNLGTPDMVISQRPGKKSRVSMSAFSKTLESQKVAERLSSKLAAGDSSSDSIPQSLESPVIKNKPGPKRTKKRMSSLGFQQVLESQPTSVDETVQSSPADPSSVNNSVIPDALDSPADLPNDVRLMNKQRKRMSTTAFSQIIEQRTNLVSKTPPKKGEEVTKESPSPSKARVSGFVVEKFVIDSTPGTGKSARGRSRSLTSTKDLTEQGAPEDQRSPEIEQMESPEERPTHKEPALPIAQVESHSPKKVIEETIIKSSQVKRTPSPKIGENIEQYLSFSDDEDDIQSSAKDIVEFTAHRTQQPSTQEIKTAEDIPQIIITDPVEPESLKDLDFTSDKSIVFKRSYARPSEKNTESIEYTVGIPDIDSPEDFAPTASSTQLVKKRPLPAADRTVIEDLLVENQRTAAKRNLSATPAKSEDVSESDIPSKLSSPEEIKRDRPRAGPASSKKRVSMTDFLAALNQKNVSPPKLETPQKSLPTPQPSPVREPEVIQQPSLEAEPLPEVKEQQRMPSITSTTSSATVILDQGSPALMSDEEKDESRSEQESGSELVLLPSEANKTAQTLASLGRSRKSLIFDSIETTVESTPAEESPSAMQPITPTAGPIESSPPEKGRLDQVDKTTDVLPSEGRSRKSLRFESPATVRDITPDQDDAAADTPGRSEEEIVEETPSAENVEQDAELPEMPEEESERRGSIDDDRLSRSSRKSEKLGLSPFNRYPGLKNSTVVAGGAPFIDVSPLSMSPIVPSEKESPATIPTTPVTPAPSNKKPSRSIAHSPMYLSVMQKAFKKQEARKLVTPQSLLQKTPITSKSTDKSLRKGASPANTLKGKSISLATVSEDRETSETEDDEAFSNVSIKPIPIELAFKKRDVIPDRSKNYVPLEKRLKEDSLFQAKVNVQKAKIEAAKAAEQEAAAKIKAARKPRSTAAKKTDDNITNVVTNKGNLRFYSKFKVAKDALDAAHDVVSEWFDFTLDQMETFCDEEGVTLDTWKDCYKMLKRQNIVKNEAEYAGLCHDLLLNDEAQDLLPSEFPAGHYESKRQAKRRRMI